MSFDAIYQKVEECSHETELSKQEALLLYNYCNRLKKTDKVIELGLGQGRSTTVIAECAKEVGFKHFAIDGFSEKWVKWHEDRIGKYGYKNTKLINKVTKKAKKELRGKYALIFVDAGHDYEEVRDDIKNYRPLLKKGGVIMFHDYNRTSLPGVKQAVDETDLEFIEAVDYLAVFR